MKAITVQQPWAWAIAAGYKLVENRTRIGTWRSAAGTTVAVHAGQRFAETGAVHEQLIDAYLERTGLTPPLRDDHPFVYGAIIALVDVLDVHPETGGCCAPWGEESYVEFGGDRRVDIAHLTLTNVQRLAQPVDCRGALGLWTVPDHITSELAATTGRDLTRSTERTQP